jgi:hypothetical protein
MKPRTAAQLCSRPRVGLKVPSRSGLEAVPLGQGTLRMGLSPERGCCSAPSQIPCIRGLRKSGVCLSYLFSAGLDGIAVFSLPHVSGAQRLLAERMITIVAHFRAQGVKFLFAGRNSGQPNKSTERLAFPWSSVSNRLPPKLVLWAGLVNCRA